MITRRKFLAGLLTLTAGTVAVSQLPVFKQDDGELTVYMEGTDAITISTPYECLVKSIYPKSTLLEVEGVTIGVGATLLKGQSLHITKMDEDTEIKVSVVKL